MHRALVSLGLLFLLHCERPVAEYCGVERACPGADQICVLPEHECKEAEQWGELSGTQVDPPNPSPFRGRLRIAQSPSTGKFHYALDLAVKSSADPRGIEIAKVRALHLHKAGVYITVAPIAQEFPIPPDGKGIGTLAVAPDDEAILKGGGYYIDLHTEQSGDGEPEVRAQLWPTRFPAMSGGRFPERLKAVLSGLQVVDPLSMTQAPFVGQVTVTPGFSMGKLNYEILLGGLAEETIAYGARLSCDGTLQASSGIHFHGGGVGINGDHVLDVKRGALTGTFLPCDVYQPYKTNYLTLLLSNLMYINVHTVTADRGEMRGQLMLGRDMGDKDPKVPVPFNVSLKPVTGPTPAATVVRFILSHNEEILTYRIDQLPADLMRMGIFVSNEANPRVLLTKIADRIPVGGPVAISDLMSRNLNLRIETPLGTLRGDLIVPKYIPR